MEHKRISIFCGHYGSGKTNAAICFAEELKKTCENVIIADLDIVNPYYRTSDSKTELEEKGIRLICSPYAGSNVDLPALPQEIYAITDDQRIQAVLDVGGDERGALALGRLAPAILRENNYDMFMVINMYRPLTPDADSVLEVKAEIENACGIPFTAIINNSNLGPETTPDDVRASFAYADRISEKTGLPIAATTVYPPIYEAMKGEGVTCIHLQKKPFEM